MKVSRKLLSVILALATMATLCVGAFASGESSSEPSAEPVEILSQTTEFPNGVTLKEDDYYGAPDGYCVLMVVDGVVMSQKAGVYNGPVVFEVVPLTSGTDGIATYSNKSIVTKTGNDLVAAESVVGGAAKVDGLYGADIVADMPYLSVVTVVDGEYAGKNVVIDSELNVTDMDDGRTGYSSYSIGANINLYSGTKVDATYGAVQSNEYSTVAFVNGCDVDARKSILMNFSHGGGVCFVSDSVLNAGEIAFVVKGSGDGYEESVAPEGTSKEMLLMGGPSGTHLYVRNSKITAPDLLVAFDSDDPGSLSSTTIEVNDKIAPKDESFDVTAVNNWRKASTFWSGGGEFCFNEAVEAYFQDCTGDTALKGNIYNCHQWTSKNMILTLDNCEIDGIISSGWCEHDVDIIEPGIDAMEEDYVDPADGLRHGNRENLGSVVCHAAETVNNGVIITLKNGTVWNVTETSYVSVLDVDDTSVVNGVVTVLDSGVIMIEPLAGTASGEASGPSGEAS